MSASLRAPQIGPYEAWIRCRLISNLSLADLTAGSAHVGRLTRDVSHGSTRRAAAPVELSRIVIADSELEASSNRTAGQGRDHRHRVAGVPAGGFHDGVAGLQQAFRLGLLNQIFRDPRLDRSGGLRNSNFTHTPSIRISGVSPMLSRIVARAHLCVELSDDRGRRNAVSRCRPAAGGLGRVGDVRPPVGPAAVLRAGLSATRRSRAGIGGIGRRPRGRCSLRIWWSCSRIGLAVGAATRRRRAARSLPDDDCVVPRGDRAPHRPCWLGCRAGCGRIWPVARAGSSRLVDVSTSAEVTARSPSKISRCWCVF
jgi:hypothetical protein